VKKKILKTADCHLSQTKSKVLKLLLMHSINLKLYCYLKLTNLRIEYVTRNIMTKILKAKISKFPVSKTRKIVQVLLLWQKKLINLENKSSKSLILNTPLKRLEIQKIFSHVRTKIETAGI
jgi:hypothetical protein